MKTAMSLQFWGVRGSIPAPGPTTMRYGGNTACVSVDLGHNTLLVLDAGTGIRALGEDLAARDSDIFVLPSGHGRADRLGHSHDVHHLAHAVDADDVRAAEDGGGHGGGASASRDQPAAADPSRR